MTLQAKETVLFQGDSITDGGRARDVIHPNQPEGLGHGYPYLIAAEVLASRATDGLRFFNLGVSGDRVTDLHARWQRDCLRYWPSLVSILIGVNDTWHGFTRGAGVPVPEFETIYRQILGETRAALPNVKLVLCEPFVLPCGVVTEAWLDEMDARRRVVRQLAREVEAVWVPFQAIFDAALAHAPAEYWAQDGVHPSVAGHALMARAWLDTV